MAELTLDIARKILDAALAKGVEKKLKPLVITILDARGCVKVTAAQDGTSLMRAEIAHGKAYGALAMGMGSRALFQRAQEQAYFVSAVNTIAQGRLIPVPGGVLIQDGGILLGAVGVSGDTSDNDEVCAVAGIEAAGLKANAVYAAEGRIDAHTIVPSTALPLPSGYVPDLDSVGLFAAYRFLA
jgi:uncharacterized protein GlcG (DUF336 family)